MKALIISLLFSISVHAANFAVKTQSTVTATTTSTLAVATNKKRSYLMLVNNGAVNVLVKLGSAHAGSEGISIVAGGYYEPVVAPRDSIYLKSTSSTASVFILEGEMP